MKTLVCKSPGLLEYNSSETSPLRSDHAIIKIKRIGVYGADILNTIGTYFGTAQVSIINGHSLKVQSSLDKQSQYAPAVKEVSTDNNKLLIYFRHILLHK